MPRRTNCSRKIRLRTVAATLCLAALAFATLADLDPAAHAQRTQRNANTSQQQKKPASTKRVFVGAGNSSASGARQTIKSDNPLNDYSAYRSGDRFNVVIPNADAGAIARGGAGRGYTDMQVQQRGKDVVLTYKLQPGAKPRVEQKFNRLDVVFETPEGTAATPAQTQAKPAANDSRATAAAQQQQNAARNAQSTAPSSTNRTQPTDAQSTSSQQTAHQQQQQQQQAAPSSSELPSATQPSNAAANTTTTTTGAIPNGEATQTATPAAIELAQARQPERSVPSTTAPANAPAASATLGATLLRNWPLTLTVALLLVGLGLFFAARRTSATAAPPPVAEEVKEEPRPAVIEKTEPALVVVEEAKPAPPVEAQTTTHDEAPAPVVAQTTMPVAFVDTKSGAKEPRGKQRGRKAKNKKAAGKDKQKPQTPAVVAEQEPATQEPASSDTADTTDVTLPVAPLAAATLVGAAALAGATEERTEEEPRVVEETPVEEVTHAAPSGVEATAVEEPEVIAETPVEETAIEETAVEETTIAASPVAEVVEESVAETAPVEETFVEETEPVIEDAAAWFSVVPAGGVSEVEEPPVAETVVEGAAVEEPVVEEETAGEVAAVEESVVEESPVEEVVAAESAVVEDSVVDEVSAVEESPVVESPSVEVAAVEPASVESSVDVSSAEEAVRAIEVAPPVSVDAESVQAEARRLLEGERYDRGVLKAADMVGRQMVASELLAAMASRNPERRVRARGAFIEHGFFNESAHDLHYAEAPAARAAAARGLALAGDRAATSHLVAALEDSSVDVRRASVEALADLRDPSAVGALEGLRERQKTHREKVPRHLLQHAIETCREGAPDAPAPVVEESAAAEVTGDEDGAVEQAAVESPVEASPIAEVVEETVAETAPVEETFVEESRIEEPSVEETAVVESAEETFVESPVEPQGSEPVVAVESKEVEPVMEDAAAWFTLVSEGGAAEVEGRKVDEVAAVESSVEETAVEAVEAVEVDDASGAEWSLGEVAAEPEAAAPVVEAKDAPPAWYTESEAATLESFEMPTVVSAEPVAQEAATAEASVSGAAEDWIELDVEETTFAPPAPAQEAPPAPSYDAPTEIESRAPQTPPPASPSRIARESAATTPRASTEEKGVELFDELSTVPKAIQQRITSADTSDRASALTDLAHLDTDEAFHQICAAFDDESREVRNAAARALFDLRPDRADSFTRALREATPDRRRNIGAAINSSGLAADAVGQLTGESREKTYEAFSLLFLMAKAGEVQPLLRAIEQHPDSEVRLAVVKLLALSGQKEVLPAFRRLAVRGSLPTEVRSAVMEAIYQISSQDAHSHA